MNSSIFICIPNTACLTARRESRAKGKIPLAEALKAKGMTACAITDHGNMYGVYSFIEAMKKRA